MAPAAASSSRATKVQRVKGLEVEMWSWEDFTVADSDWKGRNIRKEGKTPLKASPSHRLSGHSLMAMEHTTLQQAAMIPKNIDLISRLFIILL